MQSNKQADGCNNRRDDCPRARRVLPAGPRQPCGGTADRVARATMARSSDKQVGDASGEALLLGDELHAPEVAVEEEPSDKAGSDRALLIVFGIMVAVGLCNNILRVLQFGPMHNVSGCALLDGGKRTASPRFFPPARQLSPAAAPPARCRPFAVRALHQPPYHVRVPPHVLGLRVLQLVEAD